MIMNKKLTVYESPEVKVVDILAEGLLCSSATWESFEEGDYLGNEWE